MTAKNKKLVNKLAALPASTPQTEEQVNDAIRQVGELNRQIQRLEIGFQEAAARVKECHEAESLPLDKRRDELLLGIQTWCEANRLDLTRRGEVKYATFAAGRVSWRLRPPRVSLPVNQTALIEYLRENGLGRFIRTHEEVSKELLLAEAPAVMGLRLPAVRIGSGGEVFEVEPYTSDTLEASK